MNTSTLLSGVVIITALAFSSCSKDVGPAAPVPTNTVVITPPIECPSDSELYLPQSFSPNGDGNNDTLKIHYGNLQCIKAFELTIYNRWGEKIFESSDANFQWDGTYKGKPENKGVYVYIMTATLSSGEKVIKKGNLSLMR